MGIHKMPIQDPNPMTIIVVRQSFNIYLALCSYKQICLELKVVKNEIWKLDLFKARDANWIHWMLGCYLAMSHCGSSIDGWRTKFKVVLDLIATTMLDLLLKFIDSSLQNVARQWTYSEAVIRWICTWDDVSDRQQFHSLRFALANQNIVTLMKPKKSQI